MVDARRRRLLESFAASGEVLVSQTEPGLLRLARFCGLDAWAARDVVQKAFHELWSKHFGVRNPEGLLRRVVRRRSLDWLRSERHEAAKRLAFARLPRPAPPLPLVDRIALERALAQLRPKVRQLVRYRFIEGYSEEEAAVLAGYSPSSGKKTLTRALATLRKALATRRPADPSSRREAAAGS